MMLRIKKMHSYDCEAPQEVDNSDYTNDFITIVAKSPVKPDLVMIKKRPRKKIVESVQRDQPKSKANKNINIAY
jgi:hypothetical protein